MNSFFQPQAIRALAFRAARTYFETPTAYVALFVFYLLVGYLFAVPLFIINQATIKGLVDYVPLLLTFLIPAMTMGLIAEEVQSGTFETLATLPLEDWDIVLGKYLGFCIFHSVTVAGLGFFPLALSFLIRSPLTLDWGGTAGILLGILLVGFLFGAVGLFISSLTQRQIISFVGAFLICFMFFAIGKMAHLAPASLIRITDFIGIDSHLNTLAKGVFDSRDLLYFATAIFGFLYLTVRALQSRRF